MFGDLPGTLFLTTHSPARTPCSLALNVERLNQECKCPLAHGSIRTLSLAADVRTIDSLLQLIYPMTVTRKSAPMRSLLLLKSTRRTSCRRCARTRCTPRSRRTLSSCATR